MIDAIFGAGLVATGGRRGGGDDRGTESLSKIPVCAVDVPSGTRWRHRTDNGRRRAGRTLTVTFFRKKPGHLLFPGRFVCGVVELADIGIPALGAGRHRAAHVRERGEPLARPDAVAKHGRSINTAGDML